MTSLPEPRTPRNAVSCLVLAKQRLLQANRMRFAPSPHASAILMLVRVEAPIRDRLATGTIAFDFTNGIISPPVTCQVSTG
jgi:hypothetical protein